VRTSFDSRYFGPVNSWAILGRAKYADRFEELITPVNREKGGARGSGAQGKIKGLGANPLLTPCLHIDFYSVDIDSLVLETCRMPRDCWDVRGVISRSFSLDHQAFAP
jgi:hypothetical protein